MSPDILNKRKKMTVLREEVYHTVMTVLGYTLLCTERLQHWLSPNEVIRIQFTANITAIFLESI